MITLESGESMELKVRICFNCGVILCSVSLVWYGYQPSTHQTALNFLISAHFAVLQLSAEGAPPAIKRATDWATVIKAFSPSA
jgi:hypothetical protein